MKVSELMKELRKAMEKHGDLDVRLMLYIHNCFTVQTPHGPSGKMDELRYGLECLSVSKLDDFIEISATGYA